MTVINLGTGASEMVPSFDCLTRQDGLGCLACSRAVGASPSSALRPNRDRRRQTSCLLKVYDGPTEDDFRTVLVDAGLSVYEAAVEHLPRHGVRTLDAVVLTHPHDDAIGGLSSLRGSSPSLPCFSWLLESLSHESNGIFSKFGH